MYVVVVTHSFLLYNGHVRCHVTKVSRVTANVGCLHDRRGLKQIRIFSLRIVLVVLYVRCKITYDGHFMYVVVVTHSFLLYNGHVRCHVTKVSRVTANMGCLRDRRGLKQIESFLYVLC
jgi:RNase P/RNase MRP subunit POP5